MLPLAVSGTLVIGVSVVLAVALLVFLLRLENEGEARERAESDD